MRHFAHPSGLNHGSVCSIKFARSLVDQFVVGLGLGLIPVSVEGIIPRHTLSLVEDQPAPNPPPDSPCNVNQGHVTDDSWRPRCIQSGRSAGEQMVAARQADQVRRDRHSSSLLQTTNTYCLTPQPHSIATLHTKHHSILHVFFAQFHSEFQVSVLEEYQNMSVQNQVTLWSKSCSFDTYFHFLLPNQTS